MNRYRVVIKSVWARIVELEGTSPEDAIAHVNDRELLAGDGESSEWLYDLPDSEWNAEEVDDCVCRGRNPACGNCGGAV